MRILNDKPKAYSKYKAAKHYIQYNLRVTKLQISTCQVQTLRAELLS